MSEYADMLVNEATAAKDSRLERAEERLTALEDERREVEGLSHLSFNLKGETLNYYDVEIRACERDIAHFERMGA